MHKKREQGGKSTEESGRLRIGDDWNAISIIALSQSNPLKAVAEFVENSIDANAQAHHDRSRPRDRGQSFIRISDDGDGIPTNERWRAELQVRGHAHLRFDQATAEGTGATRHPGRVRHRLAQLLDRR